MGVGRRWVVAGLLLLAGVGVWRFFVAGAPSGGDGAQYLAHALALVEGRPYGDTGYLYTPVMWTVGPPTYPPGLPLTLAPVLAVFGPFSQAPIILMYLALVAFVAFGGVYFARREGPEMGWAVAVLVGIGFLLADRAHVVGSDLGFCALVWAVLVLADAPSGWSWRRTLTIALLGGAALTYRLAAAPLVPAVAALAVLGKPRRPAAGIAIAIVWSVVLLAMLEFFGLGGGAGTHEAGVSGAVPEAAESPLTRWIGAADARFASYQDGLSQAFLYPFPVRLLNRAYHVAALLLTIVGLWPWVRERWRSMLALFAGATAGMLLLSSVWQPRYLWVLFPLICFGLLSGLRTAVQWGAQHLGRARISEVRLLRVSLGLAALATLTAILQPRTTHPPELDTWRRVDASLASIGSDDALRAASNRPRKVAWFTGVPTMPLVWRDLDRFLAEAELRGVTHIVITRAVDDPREIQAWDDWQARHPDLFSLLVDEEPVRVYELTRYEP